MCLGVPLEVHMLSFDVAHRTSRVMAMMKPTYNAVVRHAPDKPVLVFVDSKKQVRVRACDVVLFFSNP